ncbi:hypothetical protein ACJWDR_23375 [Streptomyces tauricus]|uniref:hypothetical protein n=1 Tax=Streptomyces tauricus TaxID=68274 RepID=UPI00387F1B57
MNPDRGRTVAAAVVLATAAGLLGIVSAPATAATSAQAGSAGSSSPASGQVSVIRSGAVSIPAPDGVTATPRDSATRLNWTYPTDPDARRFHVYRRTDVDGAWTRITASTVTANTYDDTTAPVGQSWYYVVSVTDTDAESAPSSTVSVDRLTPATATGPAAPVIELSSPYAECTANDCSPHGGTDVPVTFTLRPGPDDPERKVGGYTWRVLGESYRTTSESSVVWTPPSNGFYVFEVRTFDVYGRTGPFTSISFKVG